MATYMPKPCCLEGSVHSGTPSGKTTILHGLPVYVAEPPTNPPKAIIVYIPDVFGWSIPNSRLLADRYAQRTGARVYLPDFMDGMAFPEVAMHSIHAFMDPEPTSSFISAIWSKLATTVSVLYYALWRMPWLGDKACRPRVIGFLKGVRENEAKELGGVKVGVAGFCWGGHYVIDLCSGGYECEDMVMEDGRPLVDAGFTAHPSQFEIPGHIQRVTVPLSVSIGDVDFGVSVEKCREAKRVLETKQGELEAKGGEREKGRFEMDIIPGAKHGFATRHHQDDEEEVKQAQRAEDQAVAFWARWLGTNP